MIGALLITVIFALIFFWLVCAIPFTFALGAWRRTRWGVVQADDFESSVSTNGVRPAVWLVVSLVALFAVSAALAYQLIDGHEQVKIRPTQSTNE